MPFSKGFPKVIYSIPLGGFTVLDRPPWGIASEVNRVFNLLHPLPLTGLWGAIEY
jgi:hypothetical protein